METVDKDIPVTEELLEVMNLVQEHHGLMITAMNIREDEYVAVRVARIAEIRRLYEILGTEV